MRSPGMSCHNTRFSPYVSGFRGLNVSAPQTTWKDPPKGCKYKRDCKCVRCLHLIACRGLNVPALTNHLEGPKKYRIMGFLGRGVTPCPTAPDGVALVWGSGGFL